MARPRKPANLKGGKSESKEELKNRDLIEQALKGNTDDVENAPEHLNNIEQLYYKWLIKEIKSSNIISNLDKPLLEQVANCLWVMFECDEHIREVGLLVKKLDRYGIEEEKENPSIKIKLNYQTKYLAFCGQLGLSPSSRASLAGSALSEEIKKEDKFLQLFG